MSERPLHDYIDMEAYDVVSGPQYRRLVEQYENLRERLNEAEVLREEADQRFAESVEQFEALQRVALALLRTEPASAAGWAGASERWKKEIAEAEEALRVFLRDSNPAKEPE